MMGVYELLDTSLAADLFTWTYRRSIQKYAVVMESVGAPDPFRLKYREELSVAVNSVVREGRTMVDAISEFTFSDDDKPGFVSMLKDELAMLSIHNCARYRVTMKVVEQWIKNGRPI
jgi:hypothetical protein